MNEDGRVMKPVCDHCERAKAGVSTGYQLAPKPCNSCVARSVARALVTFEAVRTGDFAELQATLARVLPAIPYERSGPMVKAWWTLDQQRRQSQQ